MAPSESLLYFARKEWRREGFVLNFVPIVWNLIILRVVETGNGAKIAAMRRRTYPSATTRARKSRGKINIQRICVRVCAWVYLCKIAARCHLSQHTTQQKQTRTHKTHGSTCLYAERKRSCQGGVLSVVHPEFIKKKTSACAQSMCTDAEECLFVPLRLRAVYGCAHPWC